MRHREIPESVQEMLWVAAESGDAGTKAEFKRRYPQYAAELARVEAMVEAMRKARPAPESVAQFYRPSPRPAAAPVRFALVASIVLGVALVGYGAYRITGLVANTGVTSGGDTAAEASQPRPEVSTKPEVTKEVPPAPIESEPKGTGVRPVPPTPREPMVTLRGDTTLYQAISAFRASGVTVHVDPAVEDVSLGLAPENPDALLTLPPKEVPMLLERLAPVRVQDIGPKEYLIVPLDKVRNIETPETRQTTPSRNPNPRG